MIRKFRTLGLALVAVFAMSAVVASAASAAQFQAESYPVTLTGSQVATDVFTTNAGTVKCTTATYSGSATAASATQTITPSYSGCSAFGGLVNATIDMNGCDYLFHAPASMTNDEGSGTVDIVCPTGKQITVTTSVCTVHVEPQTGLTGITYKNTTAATPKDVDVSVDTTNQIKYEVTEGCSTTKAGTFTNGSYTGEATVDAKGVGVFVN